MASKQREFAAQISQLTDALLVALVYWLAHALRAELAFRWPEYFSIIAPFRYYKWLYLVILPVLPLLLDVNGYYARPLTMGRGATLWILSKSVTVCALLAIAVIYFFNLAALSRGMILLFAGLSVVALFLKDEIVRAYRRTAARQPELATACLLVGPPEKNAEFERLLDQHPEWRLRVTTRLEPAADWVARLPELLHREPIGCVIFNVGQTYFSEVERAILACETEGVEAWLVADFVKTSIARATIDEFAGKPVLVFRSTPEISWQLVGKRLLDITGAAVGLLILGPLVMLPAALAIRLTSPGPILFRQKRSGLHGRLFTMYKFRSMVDEAEMLRVELEAFNEVSGPVFKMKQDPRVTPIGRFLRRTSIDELPQLWNVLKGEMSLVGPRPPIPSEVSKYDPWHRRRLSMKPGLTCLWQISGRSAVGFDQWMKLDLEYIDRWSLWLDIKILFRTIPVVFSGFGAH
jgi:exopolysaccharide biosynthesis polyprenyl glycosylphosphotransferase